MLRRRRGETIFSQFLFWGGSIKIGGLGADHWGSVHESFQSSGQPDQPVRLLRNDSHHTFGFAAKRQTKYVHCVCHCVLDVLIKQTDPFYDFAVGDKWEDGTCKNENNVSMCVCNPRPSPDESTTFDQSVFLSHLRHLELCGRHNVRIQNGHLQASVAKCAGKSVGECRGARGGMD